MHLTNIKKAADDAFSVMGTLFVILMIISFFDDTLLNIINHNKGNTTVFLLVFTIACFIGDLSRAYKKDALNQDKDK